MESEEHKLCNILFKQRKEGDHELTKLGAGTEDIVDDWQAILTNMYNLVEVLKVPGRKAKCKLHHRQLQSITHPAA